jgi:3',5'-cyclic AMP phosphodiesterase CpdA
MQFVRDPDIAVKIDRMKSRVRWQEPILQQKAIAQAKLVIDDGDNDNPNFSFLVIGDSGCGMHLKHNPQRKIAEMMLQHQSDCRFVLHTGDVVYQVGSSEYYQNNFIDPYREFLIGGEHSKQLKYDRLTFKLPFFLVPGNHDYYDLPLIYGILAQATWLPRRFLRSAIDLDVGWHGSFQGEAYAQAFLDYLIDIKSNLELERYLDTYYTARHHHNGDRCLQYQPGKFTRLPNRYYTFRYGNIDFFALDSNTFNEPLSIPDTEEGANKRAKLIVRQSQLKAQEQQILVTIDKLNPQDLEDAEQIDDCHAQLEQIEESKRDIEKQLNKQEQTTDWEQLDWLKTSLVASWQDETIKGRIILLHHPPYVTEASKWNQGQTLAIRDRLRQVFNDAVREIGVLPEAKSIVDLVISGHAHCLEHFSTQDTGYADSNIDWIICGGSGHSLRRQRKEGTVLSAKTPDNGERSIGKSNLFLGRNGKGKQKKRPYSFLRIDVKGVEKLQFTVKPYIAERYQHQWHEYFIDPFIIG